MTSRLAVSLVDQIETDEVIEIYEANKWSSAQKPKVLLAALHNSHALVTARISGKLVGLGNAISDGYLVVYLPHMLVHPSVQGKGVGKAMMAELLTKYKDFHQVMLTADGKAVEFYKSLGFTRAGQTEPMWKYAGGTLRRSSLTHGSSGLAPFGCAGPSFHSGPGAAK